MGIDLGVGAMLPISCPIPPPKRPRLTQGSAIALDKSPTRANPSPPKTFDYPSMAPSGSSGSGALLGLGVRADVLDGVLDGEDLVRLVVRDLQRELLLDRHHHLSIVIGLALELIR